LDLVPKTNWTVSRFTDFAARNATSLNTIKKYIFIVIYDEMESNLAQIIVIRCKSIIMQMIQVHNACLWVYNVYLYLLFKKSNCQTLNLSLFTFHLIHYIV
jgi:hypothetical protein